MEVFWSHRNRPSEIFEAERRAEAKDFKGLPSENIDIKVGNGLVFFAEKEYRIAGFSLTAKELRNLADEAERG
jgi:hypothetical protein